MTKGGLEGNPKKGKEGCIEGINGMLSLTYCERIKFNMKDNEIFMKCHKPCGKYLDLQKKNK